MELSNLTRTPVVVCLSLLRAHHTVPDVTHKFTMLLI